MAATGWRVEAARDAVLLETAWGCGGHVHDVLLQGWAVGSATADVLRINARSHACQVAIKSPGRFNRQEVRPLAEPVITKEPGYSYALVCTHAAILGHRDSKLSGIGI